MIQAKKSRLFWCLVLWCSVLVAVYLVLFIRDAMLMDDITKTGVFMCREISSEAALPLLEMDIQSLSALIAASTERAGIVYASVIDHQNKIIAYTDRAQFLPGKSEKKTMMENVSYWQGSIIKLDKMVSFSSDIVFSGTKIGEVYLSLSADKVGSMQGVFFLGALGGFALIAMAFLFNKRRSFVLACGRVMGKIRRKTGDSPLLSESSEIGCPLCGTTGTLSHNSFKRLNLQQFYIVRNENGEGASLPGHPKPGILLSEMAERDDLEWLKSRIVFQCTEIIKRLTG